MRPKNECEHHNLVLLEKESSPHTKRYRCLDCNALLYKGKPKRSGAKYDIPERELSVYTCAFTRRIQTGTFPDGTPIIERVRVCSNPGEHLCGRKKGHAYCDEHYNPKTSKEEVMRKKLEREREEQGRADAEAFDEEAKRLREELGGSNKDREEAGLLREDRPIKEEFASGVILL